MFKTSSKSNQTDWPLIWPFDSRSLALCGALWAVSLYECQLSGYVHSVHRIKLQMYFGNFNLWLYPIELHTVARTADRHEVASVGLSVAFYHYRTISSNLSPLTTGSSISGNTNCALGHSASRVNETVLFEVVRVPLNWLHLFDLPSGGNANGLIDALYIARILI